ncbi:hypothetical protein NPIL_697191 [Nephila pilipes]|uniref:Uncharacterized protein n=1 Tax=Nephila pilipes TaxID=299642 RepID=A0A8X6TQF9_NEPPI|nr:hypothetical protein NPIL_697191 [Nephila pilipes]
MDQPLGSKSSETLVESNGYESLSVLRTQKLCILIVPSNLVRVSVAHWEFCSGKAYVIAISKMNSDVPVYDYANWIDKITGTVQKL